MTALQNLSIHNCTGLTGNVDLTQCTDIRQVDASGTTVSIIMPTEPKVTKYEVGTPASINLENPTVLTPAGIDVDSYANLNSLVIKNIPNTKSYTTFNKVMSNYGGRFTRSLYVNNDGDVISTTSQNNAASTLIAIQPQTEIKIESSVNNTFVGVTEYNSSGEKTAGWAVTTPGTRIVGQYWPTTAYIRIYVTNLPSYVKITNVATGDLIFEYNQ